MKEKLLFFVNNIQIYVIESCNSVRLNGETIVSFVIALFSETWLNLGKNMLKQEIFENSEKILAVTNSYVNKIFLNSINFRKDIPNQEIFLSIPRGIWENFGCN